MANKKHSLSPLDQVATETLQRRKADRQPFNGKVVIKSSMGERTVATMRNISPFGCNIRSGAEWLKLGRFITLRYSADQSVQAIVRWVRDGCAGIEFLRPIDLHEAEWMERDYD